MVVPGAGTTPAQVKRYEPPVDGERLLEELPGFMSTANSGYRHPTFALCFKALYGSTTAGLAALPPTA